MAGTGITLRKSTTDISLKLSIVTRKTIRRLFTRLLDTL